MTRNAKLNHGFACFIIVFWISCCLFNCAIAEMDPPKEDCMTIEGKEQCIQTHMDIYREEMKKSQVQNPALTDRECLN